MTDFMIFYAALIVLIGGIITACVFAPKDGPVRDKE